jgi:hypothetical protein
LTQLEQIKWERVLHPYQMELLCSSFPTLTSLTPSNMTPNLFIYIGRLPQLRELSLDLSYLPPDTNWNELCVSMSQCSQIEVIDLTITCHTDVVPALFTQMPRLRHCVLIMDRVELKSLLFLAGCPLLEVLVLVQDHGSIPSAGFLPLARQLTRLYYLKIHGAVRLSEEEQQQMEPPSELWPSLRIFEYRA